MRFFLPAVVVGCILLSFSAIAMTTSTVSHRVMVDSLSLVPMDDFTPLLVRESSVRRVWENEQVSFLNVRRDVANAADAEKPLLREQLILQRSNLLHAHLNGLVLDFEKMDYLLERFPVMLIRLRSVYSYRRDAGNVVDGFDAAFEGLESSLEALRDEHAVLRAALEDVSRNRAESRRSIEELGANTAGQLERVQQWVIAYTQLLRKVA
ncbi:MAG: hypothetical protein IPJ89_00780 [Candidatus Iainarchaeum archaeon]|uniref:Uncharacterized protein n=1 Tax=Candidatus Iainarchaeum sp. TaxID=3101447 RepID=A0A7T9I189_9ARCH|nr:MAG: hypothetical protein IPJ89_00780 [Candidatus Diapherotrites archaeon]